MPHLSRRSTRYVTKEAHDTVNEQLALTWLVHSRGVKRLSWLNSACLRFKRWPLVGIISFLLANVLYTVSAIMWVRDPYYVTNLYIPMGICNIIGSYLYIFESLADMYRCYQVAWDLSLIFATGQVAPVSGKCDSITLAPEEQAKGGTTAGCCATSGTIFRFMLADLSFWAAFWFLVPSILYCIDANGNYYFESYLPYSGMVNKVASALFIVDALIVLVSCVTNIPVVVDVEESEPHKLVAHMSHTSHALVAHTSASQVSYGTPKVASPTLHSANHSDPDFRWVERQVEVAALRASHLGLALDESEAFPLEIHGYRWYLWGAISYVVGALFTFAQNFASDSMVASVLNLVCMLLWSLCAVFYLLAEYMVGQYVANPKVPGSYRKALLAAVPPPMDVTRVGAVNVTLKDDSTAMPTNATVADFGRGDVDFEAN